MDLKQTMWIADSAMIFLEIGGGMCISGLITLIINQTVEEKTKIHMILLSERKRMGSIPHICHRHHKWCLCKNFPSGVNFSILSEKMHIFDFFRDIFSVFRAFSRFFGCKIWFSKILSV